MALQFERIDQSPDSPLVIQAMSLVYWQVYQEDTINPADFANASHSDTGELYALHDEGDVLATGLLQCGTHQSRPEEAQVVLLAVRPELQGRKVGAYMLTRLEQRAVELGAATMKIFPTSSSEPFYKRHNYDDPDEEGDMYKKLEGIRSGIPAMPEITTVTEAQDSVGVLIVRLYQAEAGLRLSRDIGMLAKFCMADALDAIEATEPGASFGQQPVNKKDLIFAALRADEALARIENAIAYIEDYRGYLQAGR